MLGMGGVADDLLAGSRPDIRGREGMAPFASIQVAGWS